MTRIYLILGATSAIAAAYCRRVVSRGANFVLVARNASHLDAVATDLKSRGATNVVSIVSDLVDTRECEDRFAEFCGKIGMPDEVMFAFGVLGLESAELTGSVQMRQIIDVNFTSVSLWLQAAVNFLPKMDARSLIVIGSVAGDRGRRSNYIYGASKAGLYVLTEGLRHRLSDTKLHLLTVKPGLVDTPMTAHLDRSGLLWATPQRIAADIDKAVLRRRRVVYTPWFWSLIMAVVRSIPRVFFYRTNF